MPVEQARAPSLDEFKERCRSAFAFLTQFGFQESVCGTDVRANPFEVHFRKDGWEIVVAGESYGFAAGLILTGPDGRSAALGYLLPQKEWRDRRQEFERGQLGDIACHARCLRAHGEQILRGDFDAFNALLVRQTAAIEANRAFQERHIEERKLDRLAGEARDLFRLGRFANVVAILAPFEKVLPPAQVKLLALARERA